MRKLWTGILGFAAASTAASVAQAALVTLTLSVHESAAGAENANGWSLYATISPSDNAGLFAFGVDMRGTADVGGPTTFTQVNRSPNGTWDVDPADPNYDPGAVYPTKKGGYGTGRGASVTTGIVSGVTDLAAGADLVPVFGIGQQANLAMNSAKPPPDNSTGLPVAFLNYAPAANTDQALGNPFNNAAKPNVLVLPPGTVRLATGTWAGAILPSIEQASSNTKVSVWKLSHPTGTENEIATLAFQFRDFAGPAAGRFSLDPTGVLGTNQAVGGNIAVTGANNKYVSEVDQLLANTQTGNAPILTIGPEPGNVYVMAKLTGTAADIAAFLAAVTTDVDATDSQFAPLHANYDAAFGAGGFNALFKFNNDAANRAINWDTGNAAVTVDQLAAVPEPASLGLLGVAGMGLLARRRRKA